MAYNTKPIITDKEGNPISQYYNSAADKYEPVEGAAGANKVVLYKSNGTENNELSLIPILDKLSQLTGTVIDENTRKTNEIARQNNESSRVQLYEDLLVELTRIEQITEQVPQSVLDAVSNLSNKIGELQNLDTTEKTNLVAALNEVYQKLMSHQAESALTTNKPHGINRAAAQDYEEGTWTPVLVGTTTYGSHTYTTQSGRYTKVGNMVTVDFDINISAANLDEYMSGNLRLNGVPFIPSSPSRGCVEYNNLTLGTNYTSVLAGVNRSNNFIVFLKAGNGVATDFLAKTTIPAAQIVAFRGNLTFRI